MLEDYLDEAVVVLVLPGVGVGEERLGEGVGGVLWRADDALSALRHLVIHLVSIGRVGTRDNAVARLLSGEYALLRPILRCVSVPEFVSDPTSPTYVYVQVADHVALRIEAGELPPGGRLPNEREMCEEYGVSIGTVRRAVGELRDRGLVYTVPIKGTFVSKESRE